MTLAGVVQEAQGVIKLIRRESSGWHVYSRDGSKHLGGPYPSRRQAVARLRQVEHFKKASDAIDDAEDVLKHLGSKHNQQSHGKGGVLALDLPREDGSQAPHCGEAAWIKNESLPLPEIPRGGMTPVDTMEVIAARARVATEQAAMRAEAGGADYFIEDARTYERTMSAFMQEQQDGFYGKDGANDRMLAHDGIKHDGKAHVIIGLAASAKSSLVAFKLAEKEGAHVADPDIAKEHVALRAAFTNRREEAADGYASLTHEQSSSMSREMMRRAGTTQANLVVPKVKINDSLRELRKAGYRNENIRVWMVDIPPDRSMRRIVERNQRTGRFVDPLITGRIGNGVRDSYTQNKADPENVGIQFSRIDNNRGYGQHRTVEGDDFDEYLRSAGG